MSHWRLLNFFIIIWFLFHICALCRKLLGSTYYFHCRIFIPLRTDHKMSETKCYEFLIYLLLICNRVIGVSMLICYGVERWLKSLYKLWFEKCCWEKHFSVSGWVLQCLFVLSLSEQNIHNYTRDVARGRVSGSKPLLLPPYEVVAF